MGQRWGSSLTSERHRKNKKSLSQAVFTFSQRVQNGIIPARGYQNEPIGWRQSSPDKTYDVKNIEIGASTTQTNVASSTDLG